MQKKKILILEDEREVSDFYKNFFEDKGYEVRVIENDYEYFEAKDYHSIFVDRDLVYYWIEDNKIVSNYHDYFLSMIEKSDCSKMEILTKTHYISWSALANDYLSNKLFLLAMDEWARECTSYQYDYESFKIQSDYCKSIIESNNHCKAFDWWKTVFLTHNDKIY